MPKGAVSGARTSVKASRAAFVALYAPKLGPPAKPAIEETLRMLPDFCARNEGKRACIRVIGPKTFVWNWAWISDELDRR